MRNSKTLEFFNSIDKYKNIEKPAKRLAESEDIKKVLNIEPGSDEEAQLDDIYNTDYDLVWDELDDEEQAKYLEVAKSIRRLGPEEAFIDIQPELNDKAKSNGLEKDILTYAYLEKCNPNKLSESEVTAYKDYTDKNEVTEEEYNLFNKLWKEFWENQTEVYNVMSKASDNRNGAYEALLNTDWAKNIKKQYNLSDYDFKSIMWNIFLGWESNSIKNINESENNVKDTLKTLGIEEIGKSSEHKRADESNKPYNIPFKTPYYGYIYIKHNTLGDIFVSYNTDTNEIDTTGFPWEFIEKETTPEQKDFIESNKAIINKLLKSKELNNYIIVNESEKLIEAANNDYEIELFMNTWGNYNVNGADADSIGGGWMTVEQAKEFVQQHNSEEPFINDTNNCPIEVSEYDNPMEIIEQLEFIESLSQDDVEAFIAIIESNSNDFEDNKRIFEDGDFTFFAGVDNDEDLGRHYVDMVGGLEGVNNKENYIDEDAYRESWREAAEQSVREENPDLDENSEEYEDKVEEWLNSVAPEQLELDISEGRDLSEYFDYEAFGRDLGFEGWFFASTGAITTY